VRSTQRTSRAEEGLPVTPAGWREDLHAVGAAVLLVSPADIDALFALDQIPCKVLARQINLRAFARPWTSRLWLQPNFYRLTIVRLRVIVAIAIIERHVVLVSWLAMPKVQVAIG